MAHLIGLSVTGTYDFEVIVIGCSSSVLIPQPSFIPNYTYDISLGSIETIEILFWN